MSLAPYRRKRDFSKTREPAPEAIAPSGRARFVVQLHHASRRHYDFRLQVGNVLKSWAVPKGPSFDPKIKRLAVETEDHPLAYAEFEGEIPKGEYGGGHVARFDIGTWSTDRDVAAQLRKGHLQFQLHGEKLHGGWDLIRTHRPGRQVQWLLIKHDDAHSSRVEADDLVDVTANTQKKSVASRTSKKKSSTKSPSAKKSTSKKSTLLANDGARAATLAAEAWAPELARLVDAPPDGDDWLHEVKWDGYRLLVVRRSGKVNVWSRNGILWTDRVPDIVDAIGRLPGGDLACDGELVSLDGSHSDFDKLQATLSGNVPGQLRYVIFDLLHRDGVDLRKVALLDRKRILEAMLRKAPASLLYSDHAVGNGKLVFESAVAEKLEGIISKRADSPYRSGRSDDWRKIKRTQSDEYAVIGWTPPRGSRDHVGSLLLAAPTKDGRWRYVGKVGSGLSNTQLKELSRLLPPLERKTPIVDAPHTSTTRWTEPGLIVEVNYRAITSSGILRQASLHGLREDKTMKDLVNPNGRPSVRKKSAAKKVDDGAIEITHAERVVFPDSKITKGDVAAYYAAVAQPLLKEGGNRPLSLVRCPRGTGQACFFQKHIEAGFGKDVHSVRLKENSGTSGDYVYIDDARGLQSLAQMNVIELHAWGTRKDNPEFCDRVVFDLDPGAGVPWKAVTKGARDLKAMLEKLKLKTYLRTSGGKGLHVVVPLSPPAPWEQSRAFAEAVARTLADEHPDAYVAVSGEKNRKGKIFIDYLRNGRGATSVTNYSLRARAGAPVAMPIAWTDLPRLRAANTFTIENVPARVKRSKRDAWDGIEKVRQSLPKNTKLSSS